LQGFLTQRSAKFAEKMLVGDIILKIGKIYPFKVSLQPFQRLADSKGRAFGRRPQTSKHSCVQPFAKGEFQNSPVDCFERGNALAESVP